MRGEDAQSLCGQDAESVCGEDPQSLRRQDAESVPSRGGIRGGSSPRGADGKAAREPVPRAVLFS